LVRCLQTSGAAARVAAIRFLVALTEIRRHSGGMKKPAKPPREWRITLIRAKGQYLGRVRQRQRGHRAGGQGISGARGTAVAARRAAGRVAARFLRYSWTKSPIAVRGGSPRVCGCGSWLAGRASRTGLSGHRANQDNMRSPDRSRTSSRTVRHQRRAQAGLSSERGPFVAILRCDTCGEASMRDWLLLTFPLILVLYFLLFPDQFYALLAWGTGR